MTDLFLRANSEADMKAAVPFLLDTDGNWHHDTLQFSVSVVGAIPPELDVDDEIIKAGDEGFHVNLRVLDEAILALIPEAIIIAPEPATPIRVWA